MRIHFESDEYQQIKLRIQSLIDRNENKTAKVQIIFTIPRSDGDNNVINFEMTPHDFYEMKLIMDKFALKLNSKLEKERND